MANNTTLLTRKGGVVQNLNATIKAGKAPAVILWDPKFAMNVGNALRACAAFGVDQLWLTGERVKINAEDPGERLPREERMKGYAAVRLFQYHRPFDHFGAGCTPVAVEILPNAQSLVQFRHPPNPVYVFGPEDGSIPGMVRRHCHRFVQIPSAHCLNLAAAINVVLFHRQAQLQPQLLPQAALLEQRGFG